MEKIDTNKLHQVYKSSRTAKAAVEFLEGRKRASRVTNLGGFRYEMRKAGFKVENDELSAMLEGFERAKVGEIRKSPRGSIEAFAWFFTPSSVASSAKDPGKHPELVRFRNRKLKRAQKALAKEAAQEHKAGISGQAVFAAFLTENGEPVNLSFQKGLTKKDKATLLKLVEQVPAA